MSDSTYTKALRRAADLVGGAEELAQRLEVPPQQLSRWLAGAAVPGYPVFRQVVDLIAASGQRARRPTEAPAAEAPVGEGMRVLIVDDERDTVMTLGILLRSEGFDVHLAHAGAQVSGAVREFRPHAVLLDIGMPDRSGYAVAQELMKEHGPACPHLVAVTGHSGESDKRTARESGFLHHVAKPYDPGQLLGLLASLNQPGAHIIRSGKS